MIKMMIPSKDETKKALETELNKLEKENLTPEEIPEEDENDDILTDHVDHIDPLKLIPLGSTLLNLACSDHVEGGFYCGKMARIYGDSDTSKTLDAMTILKETSLYPHFDNYDLVFDDAEQAFEMNVGGMFGKSFENRLVMQDPPSDTVEDFYRNLLVRLNAGKPFIYVLDSTDCLTTRAEIERSKQLEKVAKVKESKTERQEIVEEKEPDSDDAKLKGSYETEKAKIFSGMFRRLRTPIFLSGSAIILLSQIRDTIGFKAKFSPKSLSGGKAIKFYMTHQLDVSVIKRGKYQVGPITFADQMDCLVKVDKNKLIGRKTEVQFPVKATYGIDDLTSCVDFLDKCGHWSKEKQTLIAKELGIKGTKDTIIRFIEEKNLEPKLKQIMQVAWNNLLVQMNKTSRKSKYS